MFFEDRRDAGRRLISLVEQYREAENTLVLALPRGGVEVAIEVAQALKLPLDVWVTRKIGAPFNPELAIGSVDGDGEVYLDENALILYEISDRYVREETVAQTAEIRRRYLQFRGNEKPPDLKGRTVLVVDDGVATGFTMIAALTSARRSGAGKIVCVVPVASPGVMNRLEALADEVQCLSVPSYFGAVGEFYRNFEQVSDEQVVALLEEAKQG